MSAVVSVTELVDKMPSIVRHEEVTAAWCNIADCLGLERGRGMDMIISVPRDVTLSRMELFDSQWGGSWEWNLSEGVTKAAIVSTLIAAALVAVGAGTGMAPVLIPTVVPFLFDVKRVRLERTADNYLRIIGARPELIKRRGTAAYLYDSLPDSLKADVSKAEFEEFLNQAVRAGKAHAEIDTIEVLPNGETAFKIAIR